MSIPFGLPGNHHRGAEGVMLVLSLESLVGQNPEGVPAKTVQEIAQGAREEVSPQGTRVMEEHGKGSEKRRSPARS